MEKYECRISNTKTWLEGKPLLNDIEEGKINKTGTSAEGLTKQKSQA